MGVEEREPLLRGPVKVGDRGSDLNLFEASQRVSGTGVEVEVTLH